LYNIKVSTNNVIPWADGTKSNLMTNYYDVAATLDHEDFHVKGINDDGFSHFEIGLKQLDYKYYSQTSKYSKENLVDNMKRYLYQQEDAVLGFKYADEASYKYYSEKFFGNIKKFNKDFKQKYEPQTETMAKEYKKTIKKGK